LTDDRLRQLGLNAARIRQQINEKAAGQRQAEEIPLGDQRNLGGQQARPQVQDVFKRSTRASNPGGLLEKELRAQ